MINKLKVIWGLYSGLYRTVKLSGFDGTYVLKTEDKTKIFESENSLCAYMESAL